MIQKIHWLSSYPKSGNTWVRLFITHYMLGHNDINGVQFTVGDVSLGPYHRVSPIPVEMTDEAQKIFLRPAALMYMAAINQFSPIIFKTHNGHYEIHGIRLLPIEMIESIVVVVRDPRDVCVSLSQHLEFNDYNKTIDFMEQGGSVLESQANIRHYLGNWSVFHESYMNEKEAPVLFVKYEDMLADPVPVFKKILKAFGIGVNEEKLIESLKAVDFRRCKMQELNSGFSEAVPGVPFFTKGRAGVWKDQLTTEQVDKIVARHTPIMRYFDYLEI